MKKLLTLFAVAMAAFSANAAMVEQTYEYTFTEEAAFKSPGEWQMGALTWNVSAVKADNSNAPCSWNKSNLAQQIGGNENYPSTVTMTTSGINGTVTGITIVAASSNKTQYTCEATVGSTSVTLNANGKVSKLDKPLTATGLSATGEIKFVFTQTAEVTAELKGALLIQKISITYMDEAAGPVDFVPNLVDMELAIGQTSQIALPAMHPEIVFSSSNPQIVTVDGTGLTGVAMGTATINATWNASETYNAGSASFAVNVSDNQVITFDFNANTYGLTVESTQPEVFDNKSISNNPVTIAMTGSCFMMGAVESDPANNVEAAPQLLRILAAEASTSTPGELTFSVPTGHKILRIEFVGNNTGKWNSNVGKKSNGVWLSDGVDVSSVTLTYNGDCKIYKIMIEQYPATTTGFDDITTSDDDIQATEYYDLNGVRVASCRLSPGIYITKKDSVVKKVVIR